jgi:hypothetical protein
VLNLNSTEEKRGKRKLDLLYLKAIRKREKDLIEARIIDLCWKTGKSFIEKYYRALAQQSAIYSYCFGPGSRHCPEILGGGQRSPWAPVPANPSLHVPWALHTVLAAAL